MTAFIFLYLFDISERIFLRNTIMGKYIGFPSINDFCQFQPASSTGFPKVYWVALNKREAQELETSEKRERGMIGTSEEGEGEVSLFALAFFNS